MRPLHHWMRELHLYLGLFLSPLFLVFAVSTLLLNHNWKASPGAPSGSPVQRAEVPVAVSGETGTLEQAQKILTQLKVTGEINYVRHLAKEQRLVIPVMKPGELTQVEVDLRANTATIERQDQGLGAALIYLHKMPGPHLVQFRGNWVYTKWWAALADATAWGLLFLTVSGLYLWWVLKGERGVGLVFLGSGAVSFTALVLALSWPSKW